ncbi:uncharacterized protein [Blastocystis hominis]|uniref:Uncharacterized protein n=1 Tax=Blastocystis hominis TaxID=12968 RepID=D8M413_BLAHO|nr:uncharacterized protein [Blastocystis hominis]CBK22802.2 unnamed protein product [Blastocystis hominis]|eukprot:XP_012896850.1 uncharacterized protein [Blastocystis hominis]
MVALDHLSKSLEKKEREKYGPFVSKILGLFGEDSTTRVKNISSIAFA